MQIPKSPPDYVTLAQNIGASSSPERLASVLMLGIPPDPNGRYYHWDKLRHLKPPHALTEAEWWFAIKTARRTLYRTLDHVDTNGKCFVYAEPDCVRRLLQNVTDRIGEQFTATDLVANPVTRTRYLINSIIEEAITSSQLEGAATTREVAKAMLRQNRKPRNRSEQMIANNYAAMQFIGEIKDDDLTPKLVFELHRLLTDKTLDQPEAAGTLRRTDDIHISDTRDGTIIHVPPAAAELPERLDRLCAFANTQADRRRIDPLIQAILLHFLLAYDHPFVDGNGRTARALFYWCALRHRYWPLEFVSISRVLKHAPSQYTRAYLYTETDDNDITYFLVHQLQVISQAITDLFDYLQRKAEEQRRLEQVLAQSSRLANLLNHRQVAILNHALTHPDAIFHIESHRRAHDVTYDTARLDLLKLVDLGLLGKRKVGKAFAFIPVNKLKKLLAKMNA